MDVFKLNFLVMKDAKEPIFFNLDTKTGHVVMKDIVGDNLIEAEEYIVDLQERTAEIFERFNKIST